MTGQSNYIVFPSYEMVASSDRYMSEQKLSTWSVNQTGTPHIAKAARNKFNFLHTAGLTAQIDTGTAVFGGYTLDSGQNFRPTIQLTPSISGTTLVNHVYIFYSVNAKNLVRSAGIIVLPEGTPFPDSSYTSMLLYDVMVNETTVLAVGDHRRYEPFDATDGHKHTGSPYDGPIISSPASSTVMGESYLSLDPVVALHPIAIGVNEKGVANGVAPLNAQTLINWSYNYYMGPQGLFLNDDGIQSYAFGPDTGHPTWRVVVGGTQQTSFRLQSMDMGASLYIYMLCSGGGYRRGDHFRCKERHEQQDWDDFPFCDLDEDDDDFPPRGWRTCSHLAANLRLLPYVANAWCECFESTHHHHYQRIVVITTKSAFDHGNAVLVDTILSGVGRGDVYHPLPASGGGSGVTFLEHYGAHDPTFPNTTVIGVGSTVPGSTIVLDAERIKYMTGGKGGSGDPIPVPGRDDRDHDIDSDEEHEHTPHCRRRRNIKVEGKMRGGFHWHDPDCPDGGREDALYVVDDDGDGKTYSIHTWKGGVLTRIG